MIPSAITLLAVVRANFPADSNLGHVDPTLFLSVYLVTYPILQWSLGGWILAPKDEDDDDHSSLALSLTESLKRIIHHPNATPAYYRNVLNNKHMVNARKIRTKGLTSTDEGCYMTELDLKKFGEDAAQKESLAIATPKLTNHREARQNGGQDYQIRTKYSRDDSLSTKGDEEAESVPLMECAPTRIYNTTLGNVRSDVIPIVDEVPTSESVMPTALFAKAKANRMRKSNQYDSDSFWETFRNIMDRTLLQPPVVGALLGILCAITPARTSLVDINRHSGAPLQWFFDGLYKVGGLAVPDNMLILGCNLSASFKSFMEAREHGFKNKSSFSRQTAAGIVIGKMVIMPIIGISTVWFLKNFVFHIPPEISGAF
jgi:predicted permease